jgi:molybdate transport system substrate-binding protein
MVPLCIAACFLACPHAHAQSQSKELHIAAAADLQSVVPKLAEAYEHATGIKLIVSYASSGTLTTQILNGAPVDLFLAADYSFPEKIVAANLADGKAPTPYARGTLVLWARKDSPLQPITLDSLTDPRVKTVAVADEIHAPYGLAAVSALQHTHFYDTVKPHLVVAENIAQAAQFVESGNAQLGLISLTLASTDHMKDVGTFIRLPKLYPEIRQCAVVMKQSSHRDDAHPFLDWLRSPPIQQNLTKYGLEPVL